MEDGNKQRPPWWRMTIICLALIYLVFLLVDMGIWQLGSLSSPLKLTSIVTIALSQSYFYFTKSRALCGSGWILWVIAAWMTVVSDIFLLFTDYYFPGVLSFCLAHFLRMVYMDGRKPFLRALVFVLIYFIFRFFLPGLIALSVVYALLLASDFILSILNKNPLLAGGFALFIACDICVAISFTLPTSNFNGLIRWGMWFFYLPSQVLIGDAVFSFEKQIERPSDN